MKVQPRDAEAFLSNPPPDCRALLLYGPDEGLVRERAGKIIGTILEDPQDPFRLAELTPARLKDDPAALADEAAAIAFTGGRRIVRVRDASDPQAAIFEDFFASLPGDALIVVESGDLPARAKLRKLFESAKAGAAVACYRDEGQNLSRVIAGILRDAGLSAEPDALAYLTVNLGGDRALTRRELEKLIAYKGPRDGPDGGPITLADAQACVGDGAALTLEDLAYAVAEGDLAGMERNWGRCRQEGENPISVLRALARHLLRLLQASGAMAAGRDAKSAMKSLRPPLFWKREAAFAQQLRIWDPDRLVQALKVLLEAEQACKQGGVPAELMTSRVLLRLTAETRGAKRRRRA
jgi:DNA polymerase-3 subunit delta